MGYNTLTVTFDTISDMVGYTGQQPNEHVNVLGYYSPGDEGGGTFYWDATSTQPQDSGTIFGTGTGRWKRIFTESIYVRWFGISTTDFVQNTINFQNAVNVAADKFALRLGEGTITINGSISFSLAPRIYGAGSYRSIIKNVSTTATDDTFVIYNSSSTITFGWLEGFSIQGSGSGTSYGTNGNGIYCNTCGRITFVDILSSNNGKNGFHYFNSWTPFFTLCRAESNGEHGARLEGGSTNSINGAIFMTGSFSRNYGNGLYIDNYVAGTPALSAYSLTVSGNMGYGIEAVKGSALTLVDPYFEFNKEYHLYCHNDSSAQIKAVNIVGSALFNSDVSYHYPDGSTSYTPTQFVKLVNVQNFKIEKASFIFNAPNETTTAIDISGDCYPVIGEISLSVTPTTSLTTHNLIINSGNLVVGEVLSKDKPYTYLSEEWWLSIGKGGTLMQGYFVSDNIAERTVLSFGKAGGTFSAMTNLTGVADIASLLFTSYQVSTPEKPTAAFVPIAEIKGSTNGDQTPDSKPSKVEIQTTAVNSTLRRVALRIRENGLIELPVAGSGIVLTQPDGTPQTIQLTNQGELTVVNKLRTLTGTTDPTVTPNFTGQMYINTTAKTVFVAAGFSSSADWISV
jgi:hypothetical protein